MALQGAKELHARLRAIRTVFKPVARDWTKDVVELSRERIPIRTGKTRGSVRVKNASQRKATVVAFYPVNFIDAGTKKHTVEAKKAKVLRFNVGGQPLFRRKATIPAKAARPFKKEVAQQALAKTDILGQLITLWNSAGGSVRSR